MPVVQPEAPEQQKPPQPSPSEGGADVVVDRQVKATIKRLLDKGEIQLPSDSVKELWEDLKE